MHILVEGRVQGVGFRAFTERQARELRLVGWVRNLRGGQVEALAAGPQEVLEEFLQRLRQGPPAAMVTRVEVKPSQAEPGPDFRVKADGEGPIE